MAGTLEALKAKWITEPELAARIPVERVLLHSPAEGTPVPCIGFVQLEQTTGTRTSSHQHVMITVRAILQAADEEFLEDLADLIRKHLDEWESDRWRTVRMTACRATIVRPDDSPNQQWQMDITMDYEAYRR